MKKKTLTLLVFSCSLLTSFAQTAKEEIYADILKSGSNYMAYQAPTKALTKAPKGYEPFYMSHYGRHGSRWLINENDYTSVIRVFRRANELGKLTPLGKEALAKLERFIPTTKGRLGELSDIGFTACLGAGGDPIVGTTLQEALAAFEADPDTKAVMMIGEIGGSAEQDAAQWAHEHMTKPVVAYIAGFTAPEGKQMGHAGAIVSGGKGTAQDKQEALEAVGIKVGRTPAQAAAFMREVLASL